MKVKKNAGFILLFEGEGIAKHEIYQVVEGYPKGGN